MASRNNYVFPVDTNVKGLQFIVRHQEYIDTYANEGAGAQASRTEVDVIRRGEIIGTLTYGWREDEMGRTLARMLAVAIGANIEKADMPEPAEEEVSIEAP